MHARSSGLPHQQAGFQADRHECRGGRFQGSRGRGAQWGHTLVGLEIARQVLLYHQGLFHGAVAFHHAAVLINEKLGKVPFDGVSQHAPALGLDLHPFPQWVGIIPVYTNLAVHVKLDIVAGCKLLDFLITSWFLLPELVAGESQDP